MSQTEPAWLIDYQAVRSEAGCIELTGWTQIELRGDDRAKFLHNLCTNDIKGLQAGNGCEAFLLNVQGKILFHVLVFSGPDSLVLLTVPGDAERLLAHVDRYLIREQVTLHDRTNEWTALLVTGSRAAEVVSNATSSAAPPALYSSIQAAIAGFPVWLRRVEIAGAHDLIVHTLRDDAHLVRQAIETQGAKAISAPAFEAGRIETGFPLYGRDISERNLPQEVARDERAIHFNKGCYLGQETVARIDALGHVNWKLCGLRFDTGDIPVDGSELQSGEKSVGHVTSASLSPILGSTVGLGYVRREQAVAGTALQSAVGQAEVISLPVR